MSTPTRAALGCSFLMFLAGCASLDADGLWVLPPLEPPAREEGPRPPTSIAALGTASIAAVGSRWTPGAGPVDLGHVLTSVDASYPLLSAVRQERILAEARQLGALGSFDLRLRGGATWASMGWYENHTASAGLEQQTGLRGLKVWGGYRIGSGDFDPTFDGKRVTNHGGEFSAGASLPLLRDGSIDEARRDLLTSTLDREIADSAVATRRLRFDREATVAYWRWVAAGRRLLVASSLLEIAEERQQGVTNRVLRGDLPEIEATDNQRLVVKRQALEVAARRELESTAIALSLFLRDERGDPLRPQESDLPTSFPEPARPALSGLIVDLEAALRQRPDLRQFAQRRGRAGTDLRYAENQLLPQLDLFVAGSQDRNGSRPSRTKGEFELTAGLEFSFPIQNRKARGEVLANRARIAQLDAQERFLRDTVEAEVGDALSALRAAYQRVGQARRAASLAETVAQAERRRFALGDSNVLRLNLREEAAAEAQLGVVGSLLEYWSAAAAYRAAVGAPSTG